MMKENNFITISELSQEIKISTRAVEKIIAKLKGNNLIKRIGANRGGYWEVCE